MSKIFIIGTLVLSSLCLTVQSQSQDALKEGMQLYNQKRLDQAILKFQEALRFNVRDQKALYFLGMACNYTQRYEEAATAFQRLVNVNPDYDPWFYVEASKALIAINSFPEAIWCLENYDKRMNKSANTTMVEHMIKNRIEYAKKSPAVREKANTTEYPTAVAAVNSEYGDYTPQVNPLGDKLYFTSVRKGGFDFLEDSARTTDWGEDIYYSKLVSEQWSTPKLLPEPLNSLGDDFGSAFTGDEQTMVYVRCGGDGVGNCDLYITQLVGTEWSEPVNMGNVVNSTEWESQPTISADGNRIIFTSAREGGYGGADLYMTERNHLGEWGIPQNLGSTVNTPFNDNSPYLASDGKTLYYSTNGHPGFGGADIFYCVFENGKWSKPVNLGAPINSETDDTNFSISAQGIGYFANS